MLSNFLVVTEGIDPSSTAYEAATHPSTSRHHIMVRAGNYDIPTYWLKASCSASELYPRSRFNVPTLTGVKDDTNACHVSCQCFL